LAEPFEKQGATEPDDVVSTLERGSRARQLLGLGVAADLDRRRAGIWAQAERELLAGDLTPERALIHVACSNALRAYVRELTGDVRTAERAAQRLHEENELEPDDGAA